MAQIGNATHTINHSNNIIPSYQTV